MKALLFARALCVALVLALPGHAAEFVASEGRLSDTEFLRLVSCAAKPGEACTKPMVRWPHRRASALQVSLATPHADFPRYKLGWLEDALDEAIAEINAVGAALWLVRAPDGTRADVMVFPTGTPRGGTISGTSYRGLDGSPLAAALVTVWSQGPEVRGAGIAISRDVRRRSLRSIMLEELVQALGPATDIRNPHYAGRSIFDEDSNAVTRLTGQDAMVLRNLYPGDLPEKPQQSTSR